jgi:MtrB/PioB family decaheme-associated outer membrane protein
MKIWSKRECVVLLAGLLVSLMVLGPAWAQKEFNGFMLDGEIGLGWMAFLNDVDHDERGKLEEYRDMSAGVWGDLSLHLWDKDESYLHELQATRAGREDQNFLLRTSRVGVYAVEFEWDQIPHTFSTAPRYGHLGTDSIESERDTARWALAYTPSPEWDFLTEYRFTRKDGEIPKGLAVGFPPDLNFKEVLQPIEQNEHDLQMIAGLAKETYQLQFSYNLSKFENDLASMTAPFGGGAFSPRASLAPDNMANTFALAGGANLPYRTRVNGTLSYAWRVQNQDFLPGAVNPGGPSSLDGDVGIFLFNLMGTSRPIDPLTVKTLYRVYHFDDRTETFREPDDVLGGGFVRAVRFPYTKHDGGLDLKWKFSYPVSVSVGYKWERWQRDEDVVEIAQTDEHTPKITVDYTPFDWLSLGSSYSHSVRVGSDFHQINGLFVDVNPFLRKFNLADLERDRVEFFADLTPLNNLTFSSTFSFARDEYDHSVNGLLDDDNWGVGFGVNWSPIKRVSLYANYAHDEYKTRQRVEDLVNLDRGRILRTDDFVDTFGTGAKFVLLPEKLDLDLGWSLSLARSELYNNIIPTFEDTYSQSKAYLRYQFSKNWTAKLGYIYEVFDTTDAFAGVGNPGVDTFLGDFYEDFSAHIVVGSLVYRF